jgi:hypothetical protein
MRIAFLILEDKQMQQWKIILAATCTALALNFSSASASVKNGVPRGWVAVGNVENHYQVGVETGEKNQNVLLIHSTDAKPGQSVALLQTIDSRDYGGQLVTMSAYIRCTGSGEKYEFWLRSSISAKNISTKNVWAASSSEICRDDQSWVKKTVQLIVARDSQQLEFGIGVRGDSKLALRDLNIDKMALDQMQRTYHHIFDDIPLSATPTETAPNLRFDE